MQSWASLPIDHRKYIRLWQESPLNMRDGNSCLPFPLLVLIKLHCEVAKISKQIWETSYSSAIVTSLLWVLWPLPAEIEPCGCTWGTAKGCRCCWSPVVKSEGTEHVFKHFVTKSRRDAVFEQQEKLPVSSITPGFSPLPSPAEERGWGGEGSCLWAPACRPAQPVAGVLLSKSLQNTRIKGVQTWFFFNLFFSFFWLSLKVSQHFVLRFWQRLCCCRQHLQDILCLTVSIWMCLK